jgi:hypothetical protein
MRCSRPGMPRYVPWHMRTDADSSPDVSSGIAAMLAGAGRVGTAQMTREAAQRDAWMAPQQQQEQHQSEERDAEASTSDPSHNKSSKAQAAPSAKVDPLMQLLLHMRTDPW